MRRMRLCRVGSHTSLRARERERGCARACACACASLTHSPTHTHARTHAHTHTHTFASLSSLPTLCPRTRPTSATLRYHTMVTPQYTSKAPGEKGEKRCATLRPKPQTLHPKPGRISRKDARRSHRTPSAATAALSFHFAWKPTANPRFHRLKGLHIRCALRAALNPKL